MADRNELIQEKARLVKEQQEHIDAANAKVKEAVAPIKEELDKIITPMSERIAEINTELLNDLDSEAGVVHHEGAIPA